MGATRDVRLGPQARDRGAVDPRAVRLRLSRRAASTSGRREPGSGRGLRRRVHGGTVAGARVAAGPRVSAPTSRTPSTWRASGSGTIEGTSFVQADVLDLPFRPESFDAIFSEGVLHHTPSTEAAFQALVPLLRPGGELLFYVYRRKAPLREFADDYIRDRDRGAPGRAGLGRAHADDPRSRRRSPSSTSRWTCPRTCRSSGSAPDATTCSG